MSGLLDTAALVRYLTLDPPTLGRVAQELVESEEDFVIPPVALVETAFVLMRLYGIERLSTVDLMVGLLGRSNLSVLGVPKPVALEALLLCRPSGRVSFADALIWAAARAAGSARVYTFDARFPANGIDRRLLGAR